MNAAPGSRVRVRPDAPHIPPEHRGEEGHVVERKQLASGDRILVEFQDGCQVWTRPEWAQALETNARNAGAGQRAGGPSGPAGRTPRLAPRFPVRGDHGAPAG